MRSPLKMLATEDGGYNPISFSGALGSGKLKKQAISKTHNYEKLFENTIHIAQIDLIWSHSYQMYVERVHKSCLTDFDDKRSILQMGLPTLLIVLNLNIKRHTRQVLYFLLSIVSFPIIPDIILLRITPLGCYPPRNQNDALRMFFLLVPTWWAPVFIYADVSTNFISPLELLLSQTITFNHQRLPFIRQNYWILKYYSLRLTFTSVSNIWSY